MFHLVVKLSRRKRIITWTSLGHESLVCGQQTCCSETCGNIRITATKASLLCSEILIFSHRSQHMTATICLSSIRSFVRTG